MKLSFVAPVVLLFAGSLCAAVHTDYDHHADFSKYHTYCWIGVKAGDSLWQQRIQSAVDGALAAKGLQRVDSTNCDLAVSAFGRTQERDTLQTFYDGFPGWGWRAGWWGGMGTATTEVIPEKVGNLTMDLFDGQTKQLVWRGVASEVVSDKPEKDEKKLEKAVDEMFKKFPPKEKG
jgi:hypothetical protein